MPNASIHITLAAGAEMALEVTEPPQSAINSFFYNISGQANVQSVQLTPGSIFATAFVDTPSDFTIGCILDDNGTGEISGTLDQSGCTIVIDIDGTDFAVPDGGWTMTFS